jgi:pyruvate ferredoxin oxidoreductase delta subunit
MSQDKKDIKGLAVMNLEALGGKYVANWRVYKPEINYDECIACGLCITYCPEAAIARRDDKKPEIDYRFCKGCGVCANECPKTAITMKKEDE